MKKKDKIEKLRYLHVIKTFERSMNANFEKD